MILNPQLQEFMKEPYNFEIEKELPGVMRDAIRQHPWKKLLQEEEARIRQGVSSGNQPPLISGSARVVPIWRRLAAIAAVLLVVSVSGYFVWQEFLAPPPLAVSLMEMPESAAKANDEQEAAFSKASDAFFNENYKEAVQLLSAIGKSSKQYYESQYLLAHAQHHLTNFKEAIRIYNDFLTNPEAYNLLPPKYKNEKTLRWNLALAYLGDKNIGMARKELDRFKQEIGNNSNWNKKIQLFEAALTKK